jgi:uncharacterized protein (DUF433 family)
MNAQQNLIGVGIYTIPEAAWMTGVSAPRIRRWIRGYKFRSGEKTHLSRPIWTPDLPNIDNALALSFRDLIEVRFVDYFLTQGVSWNMLRKAAISAGEVMKSTHPFSTRKFKTDGKRIFAELGEQLAGKKLLDIVLKQYAIHSVIAPYLYEGLEFVGDEPKRWFPLKNSKRVIVDPAVAFGQPTIYPEGVPTLVLARAFDTEKDFDRVAHWFSVPKKSVQDAVNYQQHRAA